MSETNSKGKKYWESVAPTIDGMLGGLSVVSNPDVQGSSQFLETIFKLKKTSVGKKKALDCGAGIGRITKYVLLKYFESVDMVEQNQAFLDAAVDYIGIDDFLRVGNLYHSALEDFIPTENFYDVIWIQWVIGYLKDEDLVLFLKRCKAGLKPSGLIVIKDNISSGTNDVDHKDGSVTRACSLLLRLFEEAELKVILRKRQLKFPKGLYRVEMFALR